MRLDEARILVLAAIKEGIAVMLWGPPGCGKSSMVAQVAEALKLQLEDVRLAQMEPTDLRGFLSPNRETHKAEWFHLDLLPERDSKGNGVNGPGILFLDEIDKAPVSVKNAALQLVLDRKVGNYVLPNDWSIVCAGNREEDGCFSVPLGAALSNRLIHVDVDPDIDVWSPWAHDNGVNEGIIGYLHFQPSHLYDNNGKHAFPSPRSWAMASKLMVHANNEQAEKRLMSAAIGEGVAVQFVAWRSVYAKVDPMDVLEKGVVPEFKANEQSLKYAVTMAIAFYVRKHGPKKWMNNIAKFMDSVPADMKVVFIKQLKASTLAEFANHSAFKDVIASTMGALSL